MRDQGGKVGMDKGAKTIEGYIMKLVIPARDCYSDS